MHGGGKRAGGRAGRQREGVWKDKGREGRLLQASKAAGERGHGGAMKSLAAWCAGSCGTDWLFSGHALCSWLIWSSHRPYSRNAEKSRLGRGWLGPFSLFSLTKSVFRPLRHTSGVERTHEYRAGVK